MPQNSFDAKSIEKIIGYEFKNEALLRRAFTHTSAESDNTKNYQTLEFLGDSIVDFIVAERLMQLYPEAGEGKLTKIRAAVVSEEPLSQAIDSLRISKMLFLGVGEQRSKIYEHSSVKCDLFESITGAIYLDGGIHNAKIFVLDKLNGIIRNATESNNNTDAKSLLNEYAFKCGKTLSYEQLSVSGPSHKPVFTFSVSLDGEVLGEGKGFTKQEAQQCAAENALKRLKP